MSGYAGAFPHVLSGGEQQRVALARAMAPRPSVLLMDEPFSGLDSRLKDTVRAETLDILRHSRATAIVVTHDAEEAMRMGDRIALLKAGRLVQVGRAEELYQRPVDLFAAGFFSELNLFEARVAGGFAETPVGKVATPQLADGAAATVAVRLAGFEVSESAGEVPARLTGRGASWASSSSWSSPFRAPKRRCARACAAALCPARRAIFGCRSGESDVLVFERQAETA